MNGDRRLIEDYLPIEAISAEASREKSIRKGHISTLHLWWARRPLVACRAAVYGALVPASRFVPNNGSDEKKKSLGRANSAKFVKALCLYPGEPRTIQEAQRHILIAHAERLTQELAEWKAGNIPKPGWVDEFKLSGVKVTMDDITAGRAPRPRVLDMFAGGGAIPLEALRLGCEAYALDLNPVAHIIQLCTLVYPQKYGKPDPTARGMAGPKNAKGETTWGGLADEVRYWGNWVLKKVKAEIGDLYPPILDPEYKGRRPAIQSDWLKGHEADEVPAAYLMPVAYLWTRTVKCKNPSCGATVPLVKQTWLCRKKGRYVALRMVAPKGQKQARFEVVESTTEKGLEFDPTGFSKAGNAACPFCGTVADIDYVKCEGWHGRMGNQLMAVVATKEGEPGKKYFSPDYFTTETGQTQRIEQAIDRIAKDFLIAAPDEPIANLSDDDPQNTLGITVRPYGLRRFKDLYLRRQLLALLQFSAGTKSAFAEMQTADISRGHALALLVGLALVTSRFSNFSSTLCTWFYDGGRGVKHVFARQVLTMVWDYAETNPFYEKAASWPVCLDVVVDELHDLSGDWLASGDVSRGSAVKIGGNDCFFDAVITDPPYYDNVPYSSISDYFYVWLKRILGDVFPEHFAATTTPKKGEIIADVQRHKGDRELARKEYEDLMERAFGEASRVLKDNSELVVVYAHKTTLGWSTLVDSLRRAGFVVSESWPLDTENVSRMRAMDSAALASSIFLVARKRDPSSKAGNYETDVVPELGSIVRERVETLWEMGISGADLVIPCVGAGLRAFTKYARVEYGNGEEVPAKRYLGEVEAVVLDQILARLSREVGGNSGRYSLAGVDPATRFFILWRYTYRSADLDAGEAIIFANGTHVELDGPGGLASGPRPLVEKKKGKYRLRDYAERGEDEKLGLPRENGEPAPLVDALHRTLWLMERRPGKLHEFLQEAQPNIEQLRLVAQALAGPALKGGELADVSPSGELAALTKLTANWRSVVEDAAGGPLFRT